MTTLDQTNILNHWIEADALRVQWEHAEARVLRCARQVISSKREVLISNAHVLDRLALEQAQEELKFARRNAQAAYARWHAALDAFIDDTVSNPSQPQAPIRALVRDSRSTVAS